MKLHIDTYIINLEETPRKPMLDKDYKEITKYITREDGWLNMSFQDFCDWKYEKGRREHGDWMSMKKLHLLFEIYSELADLSNYPTHRHLDGDGDTVEWFRTFANKAAKDIKKLAKYEQESTSR